MMRKGELKGVSRGTPFCIEADGWVIVSRLADSVETCQLAFQEIEVAF